MKKTILVYGLLGGVLVVALRAVEYRFLIVEHSLEIYGGIVALIFAALGIWLGLKLTRTKVVVREVPVPVPADGPFAVDEARQAQLGITARELEILQAMAAGLSNKEIADKLFVSENTVKTHAGSVFEKLAAKRRTQAVQIAKEARLIPSWLAVKLCLALDDDCTGVTPQRTVVSHRGYTQAIHRRMVQKCPAAGTISRHEAHAERRRGGGRGAPDEAAAGCAARGLAAHRHEGGLRRG